MSATRLRRHLLLQMGQVKHSADPATGNPIRSHGSQPTAPTQEPANQLRPRGRKPRAPSRQPDSGADPTIGSPFSTGILVSVFLLPTVLQPYVAISSQVASVSRPNFQREHKLTHYPGTLDVSMTSAGKPQADKSLPAKGVAAVESGRHHVGCSGTDRLHFFNVALQT